MPTKSTALLLFPNQLFEAVLDHDKTELIILIEDDLFFTQYRFHKQKLILHRASMQAYAEHLKAAGFRVAYIETGKIESMQHLADEIQKQHIATIRYYDLVDDWLEQRVKQIVTEQKLERHVLASPAFLTGRAAIEDYFAHNANRMQTFYEWQRKRLDVLVEGGKPVGGKWSFDADNRKPLPKDAVIPEPYGVKSDKHVQAAITWVKKHFPDNPGADNFAYPITHAGAHAWLESFLKDRFAHFGPYEDAIAKDHSQLFHSVLSPLLNTGLITPRQVITRTLQYTSQHNVPLASQEGFIRQIIGWREYMRATYIQYGRRMRTMNHLNHMAKLDDSWWDGTTGIEPVDTTIRRVLDTAYAHHIERLMVFGNSLLLLRVHPDDVYEWFMSLFIDAYDWVMVPNVYAMSQFAAGDMITTKPYISGSNYIRKMSDYGTGEWSEVWDALYWRFIADHREVFENNYRSKMMVTLYDKLSSERKEEIRRLSDKWIRYQ